MTHPHNPPTGNSRYSYPSPSSNPGPYRPNLSPHGPRPSSTPYPTPQQHDHSNPSLPPITTIIPPCPTHFDQIERMSLDELRTHLGDPASFDRFIADLPHCRLIETKLGEIRDQVREMSRRNASKEAELARLTGGGNGRSVEEQLLEERAALETAQVKFDNWLKRNSRESLGKRLEEAAEEARKEGDELTRRFEEDSEMGYAEYMKLYCEQRRLFHERSIKLARFRNFHDTQRRN